MKFCFNFFLNKMGNISSILSSSNNKIYNNNDNNNDDIEKNLNGNINKIVLLNDTSIIKTDASLVFKD